MGRFVHGAHKTEWITISVDEYESMKATIETLSSPEAMSKIIRGERELAAGEGRSVDEVRAELGI